MSASIALVADFTVDSLAAILSNKGGAAVTVAPFDAVEATLLDPTSIRADFAVIWTRPERQIPSFARRVGFEPALLADVLAEVDRFADRLAAAASRVKALFVPLWVRSPEARGLGVGDLDPEAGVAGALLAMNARLAERLAGVRGVHLLDAGRWVANAGRGAMSPKLWYQAKTPFSLAVFQAAAADVLAAIAATLGRSRRLVVVDLDETLWGNVVGEDGKEGLRLGGHDAIGEAFVDFQRGLLALTRRGVLLAIASKNDERVALDAIETHPEMVLRRKDFAAHRIGWGDKAESVAALVRELNLGLESVVFLDDDAAMRARVREAYPAVLVPEWPKDPLLARAALDALDCFDAITVTGEDRGRATRAASDEARRTGAAEAQDLEGWLTSLGTEVRAAQFSSENAPRVAQLFAKTNQMNLTTRRLTEAEIETWLAGGDRELWTFRTQDRFGDAGLVGAAAFEIRGEEAELTDFLLSCRVFGRRIDRAMLAVVAARARTRGATRLVARLVSTAKNAPCRVFFEECAASRTGDTFTFAIDAAAELPRAVAWISPS